MTSSYLCINKTLGARPTYINVMRTCISTEIKLFIRSEGDHILMMCEDDFHKVPSLYFDRVEDISVISDSKIPMRITWDGIIHWNPTGIYKVVCESDITYYPLDTQTCSIKISTWGYTQGEIQLQLNNQKTFDTSFYNENGEWDLYSATGIKSSDRSRGGESYSSLTFTLTLRRKPEFHIINTIFPMILMAFLIPMVYKLPPESGEKMGYCLTVLLAYAVYLSLISDNIPSTSKNICYLCEY